MADLSEMKPLADFPVESQDLYVPSLQELANVLRDGLAKNFAEADVTVVDNPDFKGHPWNLAASGFGGRPRIADIGGPPYLVPVPQLNKFYNMDIIAEKADLPGGFVIGAGAGSNKFVGVNCEMVANLCTATKDNPNCTIGTKIIKVNPQDGSCVLQDYKCSDFSLLANVLISEGKPGKVLRVQASKRTGEENFITSMRHALAGCYGDKTVGMGGVFVIGKGKAKFHVMPTFSETPLQTDEDVNNWLKFYDMSSPLICVGVFESHDPPFSDLGTEKMSVTRLQVTPTVMPLSNVRTNSKDLAKPVARHFNLPDHYINHITIAAFLFIKGLDLRVEHFHGYGHHGEGGHYHHDTTPDDVEYVGYFTPAERLYRMDRPPVTHTIGRD